jgi:hypothetical protein
MIKINAGKEKILSFDINIEGGNDNQIKEGRFILSCKNQKYKLMFNALIENGTVTVEIPPLDINENSGECILEMISNDNKYYSVWEDKFQFNKDMIIKVKEQKETSSRKYQSVNEDRKITVKEKEKNIKNKIDKIRESSNNITLYRTIKCDLKTINKIINENKFSMKPKAGISVKFYDQDNLLVNDLENIEYGISIGMNVLEDSIIEKNKDHTVIVDSSYLDVINENNVMFLIKEGRLIQLKKEIIGE